MLTEWWTYRPHDFLMFSPRIYWRLFASINLAWWPLALVLTGAAAGWLAMGARPSANQALKAPDVQPRGRTGAGLSSTVRLLWPLLLSTAWTVVALAFLRDRYTPILWAAKVAVWAFLCQAAGWLVLAGMRWSARDPGAADVRSCLRFSGHPRRRRVGLLLGGIALLPYAALAPLSGRPWTQAELFGLAPDPTVLFSLAVLLLLPARPAAGTAETWLVRALWLVPVTWCLFSSATLAVLGAWQALLPVSAAVLALWAAAAPLAPE